MRVNKLAASAKQRAMQPAITASNKSTPKLAEPIMEYALLGSRKIPVPTIPLMPRSTILQKPNFPVSFMIQSSYYLVIFS